jgi:hypothetical protein
MAQLIEEKKENILNFLLFQYAGIVIGNTLLSTPRLS